VVEGVKFVRKLAAPLREAGLIVEEEAPGDAVQTDEQIRDFVRYQSWGHHASCTCAIGKDGDPMAVLDGNFKVRARRALGWWTHRHFPEFRDFSLSAPCI